MIDNCLTMLLVIAMCICGHEIGKFEMPMPEPGVDERLQPYVDRFHDLLKIKCGGAVELPSMNLDLGKAAVDPVGSSVVGWCQPFSSPYNMMIDEVYFEYATDLEKEQLIFHELGHCVLQKQHDDRLDDDDVPVSIMYPYTLSESIYKGRYKEYIDEFMTGFSCTTLKNGVDYED